MPWTTEVIETDRLRLRAFESTDTPMMAELLASEDVRRYLGGPLDPASIQTITSAVVGERPNIFCVADRSNDAAIGTVRLDDHHGEPEVSYEFLPDAWGKGLATEAVSALLAWTWANQPWPSIIAVTQAANTASTKLLTRLGFRLENQFEEWDALQSQHRLHRPPDHQVE